MLQSNFYKRHWHDMTKIPINVDFINTYLSINNSSRSYLWILHFSTIRFDYTLQKCKGKLNKDYHLITGQDQIN